MIGGGLTDEQIAETLERHGMPDAELIGIVREPRTALVIRRPGGSAASLIVPDDVLTKEPDEGSLLAERGRLLDRAP